MKEKYVIRKIRYHPEDKEMTDSFDLFFDIPCDAYAVYEYQENGLCVWVEDFKTESDAQKYIIEQEG